jgi:outer membrane protein OmpA-like peptidoglycan-associated protein
MARVKVEPGGKVLVAVLIVSALLLFFLRVRASMNGENPSGKVPQLTPTEAPSTGISKPKASQKPAKEKAAPAPGSSMKSIKIFFDFNRAGINKNVYCIFDRIGEAVHNMGRQDYRIMIEGNADSIGPSWYNVELSRMRAVRVADSLSRRLGIPVKQIEVVANGSVKPLASNKTSEGRAENRRTEVHIYY